jgi:hypothetical protein
MIDFEAHNLSIISLDLLITGAAEYLVSKISSFSQTTEWPPSHQWPKQSDALEVFPMLSNNLCVCYPRNVVRMLALPNNFYLHKSCISTQPTNHAIYNANKELIFHPNGNPFGFKIVKKPGQALWKTMIISMFDSRRSRVTPQMIDNICESKVFRIAFESRLKIVQRRCHGFCGDPFIAEENSPDETSVIWRQFERLCSHTGPSNMEIIIVFHGMWQSCRTVPVFFFWQSL